MARFEVGKTYEVIYEGEVERKITVTNVKYDTQRLVYVNFRNTTHWNSKLRIDGFGNEYAIFNYGGGKKGFIYATREVA